METLFGLSMTTIAGCLGSLLLLVLLGLALVALRQPVMLKLGLRPIPRRRAQSALIVGGLMLATLIITAAFGTGDTLSHTIRSLTVEGLGEIDEIVRLSATQANAGGGPAAGPTYLKLTQYEQLAAQLAEYEQIDALVPTIRESLPVVNQTSRRSVRALEVMALRPEDVGRILAGDMRDAQGALLPFADLGTSQVYLNAEAAARLGASPGDVLQLYAGPQPKRFTVRAVASAGEQPRLLMSLRQAQALFGQPGRVNQILVSNRGDEIRGAALSPEVTGHLRSLLSDPRVAGQIFALLARDGSAAQIIRTEAVTLQGNLQADLLALAAGLEAGEPTPAVRSLLADEGLANQLTSILERRAWGTEAARNRLELLFRNLSELEVDDVKRDNLDQGELAASAFTTIFVVTGLFGIAAGLVLIFLIFVMLAAERKSEMGMTRAVGAQRGHLVQMFVFEGAAYDLVASAVGLALGVLVGLLIAFTLGRLFASQSDLEILPYISPRSLVVSYSLGMLVTFVTVLFSAYRVSRLNIVAAVRDLPEPPPPPRHLRDRLLSPFRALAEGLRLLRRWRVGRALRAWLVGVPLGVLRAVLTAFTAGPLTLLFGVLLTLVGVQANSGAALSMGVSFAVIGLGLLLRLVLSGLRRRPGAGDRLAFTLTGLGLLLFWSLPADALRGIGLTELKSGPEMLFISGFLMVAGAVMVVMFNADLLLRTLMGLLGGARRLAPVVRMAVAYPLSNPFRTGLTVGMFAVVMFSVVFMSTLFRTNEDFYNNTDAITGGFDLRAETSTTNPLPRLARAIASSPRLARADYPVVASQSALNVELRQNDGPWEGYPMRGVDQAYLDHTRFGMAVLGEGYASAEEVWQAVRDNPGYAVVDSFAVPSRETTQIIIGGPEFKMQGVFIEDDTMPPIRLEVRDVRSQAVFEVTIIGVMEQTGVFGFGVFTSQETLERALPYAADPTTHFIQLAEGVDPREAGAALESAFLQNGLQSIDQVQELRDQQASQKVIQDLLLGFLTLGLIVGVAALGVISTRSVVERRQQIGMLRALGFQREMVAWAFLIESSFVALLGIGMGAGLAIVPAYQVVQDIASDVPGMRFQVPWGSMGLVMALAYAAALLTTWLPSIQASQVTPAEALRYE